MYILRGITKSDSTTLVVVSLLIYGELKVWRSAQFFMLDQACFYNLT